MKRYFIFLIVLFLIGCNQREKLEVIDINDTVDVTETGGTEKAEINICVGSIITPEEGYAYYKRLLDYIGKKLDMKINFIDKRTYGEVLALLQEGSIDMAFICAGPYVEGHDKFGLEILVAPQVNGKTVYQSYIIVHKNSSMAKFEDLKGKTFAFVDPLSWTGTMAPIYMLQKLGENPRDFFQKYIYTYEHDDSIKAVAQGVVDGAAAHSLIWEYMYKNGNRYASDTKIIKASEPYGIPPVVVYPGLDDGLKRKLKDVLLMAYKEKEGQDILKTMFIDKFVEVDESLYDTIRKTKTDIKFELIPSSEKDEEIY